MEKRIRQYQSKKHFKTRIASLFKAYGKDPLKEFSNNFKDINAKIGELLVNLTPSFERGSIDYILSNKKPLELLADPDRLSFPATEDVNLFYKRSNTLKSHYKRKSKIG
jgi:hypothetical protein